jgi:hypothetical protein
MARTGSGKTAAFVIPMLQRLAAHSPRAGARALILSPTRELALQTHKVVRELSRGSDLRVAALVGGDSMEAQFAELAANPDVLVATPGRLLHHLSEIEGMGLGGVEYVVFDEADRLFEMGFAEQAGPWGGFKGRARGRGGRGAPGFGWARIGAAERREASGRVSHQSRARPPEQTPGRAWRQRCRPLASSPRAAESVAVSGPLGPPRP